MSVQAIPLRCGARMESDGVQIKTDTCLGLDIVLAANRASPDGWSWTRFQKLLTSRAVV